MVSNVAKKLSRERPQITDPRQQVHQQRVPVARTVTWSKFERSLVTVCSIVTVFMMISLLSTKNTMNTRQHKLQDLQSQIAQVKYNNTSQKQAIAEMTSQSQLKSAAKKYGLADHNSSVRNVNK